VSGLLLDTQVVIASIYHPERLAPAVLEALEDPGQDRVISVITAFEMAVKTSLGKLPLPKAFALNFTAAFEETVDRLSARALDVGLSHAARVRLLPFHHRDPFDRLLIAQALEEDLTVVSGDRQFAAYDGLRVMSA
jgi:PIN domain nuclease of toxin-antitoxin system